MARPVPSDVLDQADEIVAASPIDPTLTIGWEGARRPGVLERGFRGDAPAAHTFIGGARARQHGRRKPKVGPTTH